MGILEILGVAGSLSLLAGWRLYLTVLATGVAMHFGWLPLPDVLETLAARPRDVHVCLTGRRCPEEIMAIADTVTEMRLVKHAFQAGIKAQKGIEL